MKRHARNFMARVADVFRLKQSYRHCTDSFASKEKGSRLQTSDMFVWGWTKYWDETATAGKRKMRKSLAALLTLALHLTSSACFTSLGSRQGTSLMSRFVGETVPGDRKNSLS